MERGQTKIMGIINLNSDSFYEPSRAATDDALRRRVDMLLARGADILDLGAVSSRPGARLDISNLLLEETVEQVILTCT